MSWFKNRRYILFPVFLGFVTIAFTASPDPTPAQPSEPDPARFMRVGVRNFEPCVIIDEANDYTRGFEIELWEEMARRANIKFEYRPMDFLDIIGNEEHPSQLEMGNIDAGFSGITITGDRLKKYDACHSHLSTGLKIVSKKTIKFPVAAVAKALGIFILIIVVYGVILWKLEQGNSLINDNFFPGIFDGMWCVMTTMSTVGYGAVCPKRPMGRLFTCWIMATGIGYFCTVAGFLTASAVMRKDACAYQELSNLTNATVAVKEHATAQRIAKQYTDFLVLTTSAEDAVKLVERGRVNAALVDAPVADGMVKKGVNVALSGLHARQDYGIFLSKDDPSRHDLNIALRTMIEDGTFNEIYNRWF